jgi:hypothetical protein
MAKEKEPLPFVTGRVEKLPRWAQELFSKMRCEEVNRDFAYYLTADVRRTAKQIIGQNLTFADDDLRLLGTLAVAAIEADLHFQLPTTLIANIERARADRSKMAAAEAEDASSEGQHPSQP